MAASLQHMCNGEHGGGVFLRYCFLYGPENSPEGRRPGLPGGQEDGFKFSPLA